MLRSTSDTEVLPLIGSLKKGIMHICMTFLQEGDEALIPDPGLPHLPLRRAALTGATPVTYALGAANSWQPDLDALEKTRPSPK